MGNYPKAIQYLQQGLQIAEQLSRKEDEAKIRHRLGLALWAHGKLQEAKEQLYGATELFESIRREAQFNNDYKLSLFDLQTASYQSLQVIIFINTILIILKSCILYPRVTILTILYTPSTESVGDTGGL